MENKWKSYEEVSQYLIKKYTEEFGLEDVEGKQEVKGYRSGTDWVIDAKGISEGNTGFIVIECRRYNSSKQKQEHLGGLAYRIIDTGAKGGIIVSPLGLQKGAKRIANAENIIEVKLSPDSNPNEYFMQFLNKVMVGIQDKITIREEFKITKIEGIQDKGNV